MNTVKQAYRYLNVSLEFFCGCEYCITMIYGFLSCTVLKKQDLEKSYYFKKKLTKKMNLRKTH